MKLEPPSRTPEAAQVLEDHENLVSAIAVGKVLAFLVYSFFALFLAMGLAAVIHVNFPQLEERGLILPLFAATEIVILYLVIKGKLPATSGAAALPFSEKQAAWGLAALSFVPWLLRGDPAWFTFCSWLINGMLLLVAVVFFVVKSVISGEPRYEVLGIALIPATQLYLASLSL